MKIEKVKINCKDCVWFSKLENLGADEPSEFGCYHNTWAGYVNPEFPACGGQAYRNRTKFQMSYDE